MAKFAANNNKSAFIKLSPFFASKNFYPHMSFDIIDLFDTSTSERIHKQKALDIVENIEITWEFARKAIASVQESWSKQVDKY